MDVVSYAMGEGAGYSKGYKDGQDSDAYQEGYTDGEAAGYDEGYTAGEASVSSVKNLIDTVDAKGLFAYDGDRANFGRLKYISDEQLNTCLKYGDTENATDMRCMFSKQVNITTIPNLDTHNVTKMDYMFDGAYRLKTLPNLDTSNVISMEGIFSSNQYPMFALDVNVPPLLDTSNVQIAERMFGQYNYTVAGFTGIKTIPLYDFSKVTNASYMFDYCKYLESIPALDFKALSSTYNMFRSCNNLREIHIKDIHYYLDISVSTKFTREALVEIIGNLRDMTGSTAKTLKIGATNMAKLTDEDIAVATAKNWTIA